MQRQDLEAPLGREVKGLQGKGREGEQAGNQDRRWDLPFVVV